VRDGSSLSRHIPQNDFRSRSSPSETAYDPAVHREIVQDYPIHTISAVIFHYSACCTSVAIIRKGKERPAMTMNAGGSIDMNMHRRRFILESG
jgi:hypothetical protein